MQEKKGCLICNRISKIKQGKNPYFVKELESGYAVIGDHQFYKGYSLLLSKEHVNELHKLKDREQFLKDMSITAEAVYKAFSPVKLNYALLGNTDEHVHWHLFPRHQGDPKPKRVVWLIDKSIREAETTRSTKEELRDLIKTLRRELDKLT